MRVLLLKNLTDAVGRKYSQEELLAELIKLDSPLLGEIRTSNTDLSVDLSRVSHQISNIRFDDSVNLFGDIEFLSTPMGEIVKSAIEAGANVRYGIRAFGYVDKDLNVTDLNLVTFDVIFNNK